MANGKVIASDLDGTLFYPKNPSRVLSKDYKKFLLDFIDDGGRFVMVSSRTHLMPNKVAQVLGRPVDSIGCNGATVMANGKIIMEKSFDREYLKEIIDFMRKEYKPRLFIITSRDQSMVMTRTSTTKFTNLVYFLYEAFQGVYKEPYCRSDFKFFRELDKGHVYKLMVLMGVTKKGKEKSREANSLLRKKFPEAEFSWLGEFIEITPKGVSKGEALAFYLDYMGISKDNVIVVGDNGNDISMFNAFHEKSYCMEHADPHVIKHAAKTIKRFSDLRSEVYPSEDIREKSGE